MSHAEITDRDADERPWSTDKVRPGQVFVQETFSPIIIANSENRSDKVIALSLTNGTITFIERTRLAMAMALDGGGYRPLPDDKQVVLTND